MRSVMTDFTQHFIGIFNDRRTLIRAYRRNFLAQVHDFIRIFHDNLIGFFTA